MRPSRRTSRPRRTRAPGAGLALAAALALPGALAAQGTPAPCEGPGARDFDFWIGEWAVTQEIRSETGAWETYAARSTVTPALDGCALVERWQGTVRFFWEGMGEPEAIEGLSVRAPGADGAWRIHWMDSRSPGFGEPWVGGFDAGEGTFLRPYSAPGGGEGLNRIRFFDVGEHTVEWELAVSPDGGTTWTPLWRMHFERVEASGPGDPGERDAAGAQVPSGGRRAEAGAGYPAPVPAGR